MKKLIVSYLLSVIACQVMAQDDDMYFASDGSQKAQKVGNSVSSSNSAGGYKTYRPYVDNNTYNPNDYCGSDRDVDEYNRRYRPEHDPHYNKDSVTISMNDYENYMRMKRWDGYRSTTVVVVDDPWYYDPWYYDSWYYGSYYYPWYSGWSWRWGYSYYPWYSSYYWRPYYYSSWGWYGRGWHGRYWGYAPVHYRNYNYRGGYANSTYSGRRSGWTTSNDAGRRSYNRPSSYGSTSYGRRSGNINSGTGGLRSSGGTTYQRSSGTTPTSSMRRSSSSNIGTRSSGGGGFSGGGGRRR